MFRAIEATHKFDLRYSKTV